jgi:tetratricopeptide (TPR) repeat protein
MSLYQREEIQKVIQLIHIDEVEDNPLEKFQYLEYSLMIADSIQEKIPIVAELYHDIAILQLYTGSYFEAVKYFEKAVSIAKYCQLDLEQILYQSNLANHLTSLSKYEEAKKVLTILTDTDLSKYKGDYLSISKIQSNIASIHGALGDNKKAIKVLEESLQADKEHFGNQHGIVAAKKMKLARMYCNAGKSQEAIRLAEQGMNYFTDKFSSSDDRIISPTHSLAVVYNLTGRGSEGEPLLNSVYELYLEKLGKNHPTTIQCQTEVGLKHLENGGNPQAVKLLENSLKYYLNNFGKNHPNVANCKICLALVYLQQGKKTAIKLAEQAVQSDLQNLGEAHPEIAWKYNVLGMCYLILRNVKKAEKACSKSLKLTSKHFGEQSTNTGQVLYTLAQTYFYTKQYQKAKEALLRYDNIMRYQIGENYPFLKNVQKMVQQSEMAILKKMFGN